jgi:putative oxidoreductase
MEYGLLLLRVVVGLLVAWRGRERFGRRGTARLSELGYRAPTAMALLAGLSEVVGGLLLALGFLTPFAAFAIAVVALNRIAVRLGRETAEAPVLALAAVVALAATGPGRLSIDRALGWDDELSGLAWAGFVLGAAALTAFFTITLGRARAESMEVPA